MLFFTVNAFTQSSTLKSDIEAKSLSKKIADLFTRDSFPEIFKLIEPYWPVPKNEIDNFQSKTISTMNTIRPRYGEPLENLKIKEEKIGAFALRETYLVRYTYHALRIIITYYKNSSGWIINAFTWDDSYVEEFKQ
jgi:hypothetical protein